MEQTDVGKANAPQATAQQAPVMMPVVMVRRKKKRKYSRGLKNVQIMERGLSKASYRVARAVTSGLSTYRKRRNKSARKRRDGAILDFVPNVAQGMGKTLRRASLVPYDLTKTFYTKRARRRVRAAIRLLQPFGAWRK